MVQQKERSFLAFPHRLLGTLAIAVTHIHEINLKRNLYRDNTVVLMIKSERCHMFLSNWFEIIIIRCPSSLFSLQSLPFIPPHCCSNRWLFFTNCYCMLICIYTYILKHNLFSLYIVNPMYIFKTDHLALDNQLMCSSLGKTTIKSFHFKWHHFSDVSCFYDRIVIKWNYREKWEYLLCLQFEGKWLVMAGMVSQQRNLCENSTGAGMCSWDSHLTSWQKRKQRDEGK